MTGTSGLPEKVKATEGWMLLVFVCCIMNFITFPIFSYIIVSITRNQKRTISKYLVITTFSYLICLFILSLSQFLFWNPSFWGFKPSIYICQYIKRPSIVFLALTRYFFYEFCLLRIRIIFGNVGKYKCSEWQYIVMQILINGYLIYHAIIFNILTTMKPHPIFGFCFATQKQSDIHVGIIIIWDAIIVFILLSAFSIKLMLGLRDRNSSNFKKKTSLMGILSTLSSLMVTVLFFLGRMNRFVFELDGFINSICMVFTFNMTYVSCPKWSYHIQTNVDKIRDTQMVNVKLEHTKSVDTELQHTDNSEINTLCTS